MAGLISNGTYVLYDTVVDVHTDGTLKGTGSESSPLGLDTSKNIDLHPQGDYEGISVWHKEGKSFGKIETNNEYDELVGIYSQDEVNKRRAFLNTNRIGFIDTITWKDFGGSLERNDVKVYGDGWTASLASLSNDFYHKETVLWDDTTSTATGTLTISEPVSNFEFIRVEIVDRFGFGQAAKLNPAIQYDPARQYRMSASYCFIDSTYFYIRSFNLSGNYSGTSYTWSTMNTRVSSSATTVYNGTENNVILKRIVGINRKAS